MKYQYLIIFIMSSSFMLTSCLDDRDLDTDHDCTFVQIDENMDGMLSEQEELIIERCSENAFSSRQEIVDNLLGQWELAGYVNGSQSSVSQPCVYLKFNMDELIFFYNDGEINEVTRHDWQIIENLNSGFFSLGVDTDNIGALEMTCFSQDFMFGNSMVLDGNTYIYQKVL